MVCTLLAQAFLHWRVTGCKNLEAHKRSITYRNSLKLTVQWFTHNFTDSEWPSGSSQSLGPCRGPGTTSSLPFHALPFPTTHRLAPTSSCGLPAKALDLGFEGPDWSPNLGTFQLWDPGQITGPFGTPFFTSPSSLLFHGAVIRIKWNGTESTLHTINQQI